MSLSTLALFLTRQSMTGGGQRTLYTVGKEVTTADMVTEVTRSRGWHCRWHDDVFLTLQMYLFYYLPENQPTVALLDNQYFDVMEVTTYK